MSAGLGAAGAKATVPTPERLWVPPAGLAARSEMKRLCEAVGADDYEALWEWSVTDIEQFWRTIWDRYQVQADGDPSTVLTSRQMPGARWFPDVALSFPEHVFRDKDPDALAVQFAAESRPLQQWTWRELRDHTARIQAGLRAMGIGPGDRVVGYLPNIPETLAAFLAVSSLGAVWSCCSPDFGARAVADRFAQLAPRVLLAADGYRYGGKDFDRRAVIDEIRAALPTLERTVRLPRLGSEGDWDAAFPPAGEPLTFTRVPFGHPLWIVYSSGTTGVPKAIVHGHGGPLLEHLKTWRLHHDARPGDRILWYASTGWIMWNYLVSALLSPVSIVLYDGSPVHPGSDGLWEIAEGAGVNIFGTGAAYLHSCMKAGVSPRSGRRLSGLRMVGSTGSPLTADAFRWIYSELGRGIWLSSTSGGTDIATGLVGGCPIKPVYAGELQARLLGVAVEAWNDDGQPLIDGVGELVVTQPMPSMPVQFWNDPGGKRYRDSYFGMFPGVWRHGDWIRITPRGSAVIYGRSDSTINRAGIRMGTSEIYSAVLEAAGVTDALVVDVRPSGGAAESVMILFVVLGAGVALSGELVTELRQRIRREVSPRHVPDAVLAVPEVPRTLSGKILEVPIKKLLMGHAPDTVADRDALANPASLGWFIQFAQDHQLAPGGAISLTR